MVLAWINYFAFNRDHLINFNITLFSNATFGLVLHRNVHLKMSHLMR